MFNQISLILNDKEQLSIAFLHKFKKDYKISTTNIALWIKITGLKIKK